MSGQAFLLVNYVPGTSPVHRAPLWLKFLVVVGCGMGSFLVVDWVVAAAVLGLMCALFLLSGAGPRAAVQGQSGPSCPCCLPSGCSSGGSWAVLLRHASS